ncbi:MAG: hypothetical protein ACI4MJ_00610 [Aristaeellaceae bacterium]
MKRFLLMLLTLTLLTAAALAEPLPLEENAGVYCYPEDADESSARYVYRYAYPYVAAEGDVALTINEFYAYLVDDAFGFAVPMAVEALDPDSPLQAVTSITSEITCNDGQYLSVKITNETLTGAAVSSVVSGHTFVLTGEKAGTVTSLPYLLGILEAGETDEWLLDRQTAKADELVRSLVWEVIQEQMAAGEADYYDDLTYEQLSACFYPEEDFYMDDAGNLMFFVQASVLAPAASGIFYFPFSLEELLDEL